MKKTILEFRALLRNAPPFVVSLLVLSIVGMNLLANKSIDTGLPYLALDCGIFLSWLTFLCMDVLTRCCGPVVATAVSLAALAANLLMAVIFYAASMVPGAWGESYVPGSGQVINQALDNTFRGTWYIILGSSIAFIVSAALNNYLNHWIGCRLKSNRGFGSFALRSYTSTFIGQFTDNLIFAMLVSRVFFGWTGVQCITCALTGALMELTFEILFSPMGYRVTINILKSKSGTLKSDFFVPPADAVQ